MILKPFSGDISTCEKCQHVVRPSVRYMPDFATTDGSEVLGFAIGGVEAMIRECPKCSYTWAEQLPGGVEVESE